MKVIYGVTDDTGNWAFSASPASSASNVQWTLTGNQLTINSFSNTIDTYAITITATRAGYPTLSKTFSLSKSKQGAAGAAGATGATGTSGAAGARGTMQFYVASAGLTSWSDTLATNATAGYGGNKVNDTVTEYNSSGGFSETRFWNGSAWVAPGQVIDGNLLVTGTIGAAKIAANAITAEKINAGAITADKMTVSNLSAVSAAMGTLTSGKIQSPDGSFVIDFTNKYINITV